MRDFASHRCSVTIVLAYLILFREKTLRQAFEHVYALRSCVWPNDCFMSTLIELEMVELHSNSLTQADYVEFGSYEPPRADSEVAQRPSQLTRAITSLQQQKDEEAAEAAAKAQQQDHASFLGMEGAVRRMSLRDQQKASFKAESVEACVARTRRRKPQLKAAVPKFCVPA